MHLSSFLPQTPRQVLLWLLALVSLAYANAFNGVFQFDDYNVIVDYAAVHNGAYWRADLGQGIRPLLKLTYLLNWISGLGAPGFHAVNVAVHLTTACLVYRLSQEFLRAHGLSQRLPHVAWLAAALFLLHPANTEAVTYISGRSTSLMALLYLAGLMAYVTRGEDNWAGRARLLPALCFVLALCVKETAVTFPLALLLWDLAIGRGGKASVLNAWTCWATLLLGAAVFLLNDAYVASMQRSTALNTLAGNAATQLSALAYLLWQWALPVRLNIDPDLALQQNLWQVLPALLLLFALLLAAGLSWRKRPWTGFAIAWALLHLLPLHVFLPRLDVANDRQLYLAAWPLGLALVIELQLCIPRRFAAGAIGVLLVCAALLSALRNQDYRSEIALWQQTARLSPGKSRVHTNLGYAYQLADRSVEARREYLLALNLDAGNVKARLNLRRLNAEQAAAKLP